MKEKYLIVSADDLGITEPVTDGIFVAHRDGIVTSTSLVVNMSDSERAARLAGQTPSLDVGLHLNITEGKPILSPGEVRTLVNGSGDFYPKDEMIPRIKRFKVNPHHMEAEFAAQIDRIQELGICPTHLDSHHHVHIYPLSAWVFKRIALKFGVRKVRMTRYYMTQDPKDRRTDTKPPFYRRRSVIASKNILKTLIHKTLWRNLICPKYSIITPILSSTVDALSILAKWVQLLSGLPEGVCEATSHPSLDSGGALHPDPFSKLRAWELEALTSPEVKKTIHDSNVRLMNFRDL